MADIVDIEGIGPVYAAKLRDAGVATVEALLGAGATPKGREALVAKTGISASQILRWVNHADLYRVKGIGSEWSELLEAAGVDTVVELAQRNASNLAAKMAEVNKKKKLVRVVPSEKQVADWVQQAKNLPRKVSY